MTKQRGRDEVKSGLDGIIVHVIQALEEEIYQQHCDEMRGHDWVEKIGLA